MRLPDSNMKGNYIQTSMDIVVTQSFANFKNGKVCLIILKIYIVPFAGVKMTHLTYFLL